MPRPEPAVPLPLFLRLWFGLDLVLALLPPLHWWASGAEPILGIPRVLAYLFGTSLVITASVVAAFLHEAAAGPHAREEA